MNQAHIHLIVNHAPILGSLFALVLLGIGLLQKNDVLTRAGLGAVLVAGLLGLPAQLTGEGAAKIAQDLPRVGRALIADHSTAAEQGLWALEGAAVLALLALMLLKHASPRARLLAILALGTALLSFGLWPAPATSEARFGTPRFGPDLAPWTNCRAQRCKTQPAPAIGHVTWELPYS
ncbi:hypothetical protein [Hymenobacter rubidus]|uniref:hypothetical protein n=1 Tax=Hymenobacter rubidus TaxID=1441626 RepID=UPI0019201DDF|nr:hypothetical protein [Hymenobacter rubidus]